MKKVTQKFKTKEEYEMWLDEQPCLAFGILRNEAMVRKDMCSGFCEECVYRI